MAPYLEITVLFLHADVRFHTEERPFAVTSVAATEYEAASAAVTSGDGGRTAAAICLYDFESQACKSFMKHAITGPF